MSAVRWTASQGEEFVRRWRRSGQSMFAFAREHGVNPQRLRYWRDRIEGSDRRQSSSQARKRITNKLVPGVVVGIGDRAPITVHIGRSVIVEALAVVEIDPRWLAQLASALEEAL